MLQVLATQNSLRPYFDITLTSLFDVTSYSTCAALFIPHRQMFNWSLILSRIQCEINHSHTVCKYYRGIRQHRLATNNLNENIDISIHPWRWGQHFPPKCWYLYIRTQKNSINLRTVVRTPSLLYWVRIFCPMTQYWVALWCPPQNFTCPSYYHFNGKHFEL